MILDTSFLIDLMNTDEDAVAMATAIESNSQPQRIPAQVVYELYVGVGYTETPSAEVSKIQSVLEARPTVEVTEEIAKQAGRIDGQLRRTGGRVGEGDVVIGATAIRHNEPVITGNPHDFSQIPDVKVRSY
ncbi:MAG: type II toxin-antitoxin system VapC family toxin [Halopenitus sp.]